MWNFNDCKYFNYPISLLQIEYQNSRKSLNVVKISCIISGFDVFFLYLGNEAIHLLTTKTNQELRVDMEKFTGEKAYAKYSSFSVGTESQKYKLTIGGYKGNAG